MDSILQKLSPFVKGRGEKSRGKGGVPQSLDLLRFTAALTLSATDPSVLDRWGLA